MRTMSEIEKFRDYLKARKQPTWRVLLSRIENSSSKQLKLIVEPYGYPIVIPPGSAYEIVAEEPDERGLHLEFSDDYLQLWANGLIDVFDNGVGFGVVPWRDDQSGMG